MARIRTIKPQHVNDKELSKISLQAHLFWVLSWCFSDDEGVIENDPLLLRSQLFPRRTDIRVEQVQQWIDQLVKARFMIPFTHEGEGYLLHRTFKIHQKIDRPQPSKIPSDTIRRIIDEQSTNDQPCIVEESNGKDSNGEEAQAPERFDKKLILENPFSDKFLENWIIWKNYKKSEFKFLFKSIESEQAAMNALVNKSGGNEDTAIKIIHQSLANGWKGLFELKKDENGQSNSKNGKPKGTRSEVKQVFDKFYTEG
jgi:hypothetical protein